jgi:hypothetical protein
MPDETELTDFQRLQSAQANVLLLKWVLQNDSQAENRLITDQTVAMAVNWLLVSYYTGLDSPGKVGTA